MSNQGEMNYEVIDNKDKKRFEIHIDDQIALEDYEFFTTSQSEKGIEYKHCLLYTSPSPRDRG